jgi:hypothetical protein
MKKEVVYVYVTSYAMSIGGEHFYGKLKCNGHEEVILTEVLTQKLATYLNKKDSTASWNRYKQGDRVERFSSYETLIAEAKRVWKKEFPSAVILIEGERSCGSIQEILDAPNHTIMNKINELYKEAEALNYYSGRNDKRMEAIDKGFNQFLKITTGK